ncbi:DUF2795 domain-containing protein [Micromonospora echinofusca]|uniref:DUF2795 domain-containing protein n=1 Tax=Micromonospora echinofusca TaxID=47858 RepID=A0ABS3W282_MICEH|nr:DUF2795 domain-containing protein [Micromonospora echinofusca]MBO4210708.1 DUF2795 domain-containing protein [Micromonospora echinofusca]
MSVTGVQLQEFLGGLDYPVSRDDLLRRAQEAGAGTPLLQSLRTLPVAEFGSPEELVEALRELPG